MVTNSSYTFSFQKLHVGFQILAPIDEEKVVILLQNNENIHFLFPLKVLYGNVLSFPRSKTKEQVIVCLHSMQTYVFKSLV